MIADNVKQWYDARLLLKTLHFAILFIFADTTYKTSQLQAEIMSIYLSTKHITACNYHN